MIKKVEHVALIVRDMNQSIDFYTTMFGFKVRTRGESKVREICFLFHENQSGFEIELIRDLVPQEYAEKGIVNHLAFTVESIETAMAYYKEKGISFLSETPNIAIDGAKTIFFSGLNQELLQLVEPNLKNK
ncbi:VOC family protein [Ectobacillus panaciterrae]|uniref:VOC family protein n=1 Tax=Ectobacillus panaciterrae TaxID=363872 RepID=UPI000422CA08|nr:VOC family protein [Ectobacillus panaciterrae]